MRFSIIVTAYNIEKYIKECLDSITNQTYSEPYEVFVVNDGSTDNTGNIIRKFSSINYIEHENKGISYSRNEGIDQAKGDYLVFMDGDDYMKLDYLERVSKIIDEQSSLDLIPLNYICQNEIINKTYMETDYCESHYTTNPYEVYDYTLLCACLYVSKRELWNDVRFPIGKYHEDVGTMYKIVEKAKNAYILADPLYIYRRRPGSITQTIFKQRDLDLFEMSMNEYYSVKDKVSLKAKKRIAWSLRCVSQIITYRYKRNELTERAYQQFELMKDFNKFIGE